MVHEALAGGRASFLTCHAARQQLEILSQRTCHAARQHSLLANSPSIRDFIPLQLLNWLWDMDHDSLFILQCLGHKIHDVQLHLDLVLAASGSGSGSRHI